MINQNRFRKNIRKIAGLTDENGGLEVKDGLGIGAGLGLWEGGELVEPPKEEEKEEPKEFKSVKAAFNSNVGDYSYVFFGTDDKSGEVVQFNADGSKMPFPPGNEARCDLEHGKLKTPWLVKSKSWETTYVMHAIPLRSPLYPMRLGYGSMEASMFPMYITRRLAQELALLPLPDATNIKGNWDDATFRGANNYGYAKDVYYRASDYPYSQYFKYNMRAHCALHKWQISGSKYYLFGDVTDTYAAHGQRERNWFAKHPVFIVEKNEEVCERLGVAELGVMYNKDENSTLDDLYYFVFFNPKQVIAKINVEHTETAPISYFPIKNQNGSSAVAWTESSGLYAEWETLLNGEYLRTYKLSEWSGRKHVTEDKLVLVDRFTYEEINVTQEVKTTKYYEDDKLVRTEGNRLSGTENYNLFVQDFAKHASPEGRRYKNSYGDVTPTDMIGILKATRPFGDDNHKFLGQPYFKSADDLNPVVNPPRNRNLNPSYSPIIGYCTDLSRIYKPQPLVLPPAPPSPPNGSSQEVWDKYYADKKAWDTETKNLENEWATNEVQLRNNYAQTKPTIYLYSMMGFSDYKDNSSKGEYEETDWYPHPYQISINNGFSISKLCGHTTMLKGGNEKIHTFSPQINASKFDGGYSVTASEDEKGTYFAVSKGGKTRAFNLQTKDGKKCYVRVT